MDFALNTLKFEDVREQIIKYLSENNAYKGQFNFRSANISYFIDAMAYVAMTMNYNVSQVANNTFLDTTDIRKNAVSRAREIGYTPKRPMSAKFRGRLTYKGINFTKGNKITINARSPFVGSFGNIYYNLQPIELNYQGNPTELVGDYTLSEGSFKYFKVNATGAANFSFKVANKNMDDENLSLFVIPKAEVEKIENGLLTEPYNLQAFLQYKWERVKTFKEILDTKVYYVEEDVTDEGSLKVVFGNGIFGAIPSDSDVVFCEYFETKGGAGNNENLISLPPKNVVVGTTDVYVYYNTFDMGIENKNAFSVDSFLSGNSGYQNIYNKSFGGSDIETITDIKFNAPRFYSSAGRAVTQNDYVYILKTINGVGDASVTGGMDLYPNNYEELGNIYICVVPVINPLEFLYVNSIYIAPTLADEIRTMLKEVSIISTTRHFYKPSYIIIDITPNIELARTVTVTEQAKIQEQVKTLIQTYFDNTYNKLGIPFRESKVSVPIDSLEYIVSSFVDLGFSFVINNETVAGLVEGLNNIIYLPTRKAKDAQGKTIQVGQVFENGVEIYHGYTKLTNFIMTNSQVVRYNLLPNEDWSILDSTYSTLTPDEKTLWRDKQHKMINRLSSIKPEECSIYNSGLIHDTLQRALYNDDFTNTKTIELSFMVNEMKPVIKTWNFVDYTESTIFTRVVWDSDNNPSSNIQHGKILFGLTTGENATSYEVADIITTADTFDTTKSKVQINIIDYSGTGGENQPENLAIYFNIDSSQYIFYDDYMNKIPFKISQVAPGRFNVDVRVLTSTTNLTIDGTFPLYNVVKDGNAYTATPTNTKVSSNWSFADAFTTTSFSALQYNGTEVAAVEASHLQLAPANKKFYNYIGLLDSQIKVSDISLLASTVANNVTYPLGSYFIVASAFESNLEGIGYCQVNDILFVDSDPLTVSHLKLKKTDIKKFVSSSSNANVLTTNLIQGDLYTNDVNPALEDYFMYDTSYSPVVTPKIEFFREVTVLSPPINGSDAGQVYSVDATVLLPRELLNNYMVRIVYDGSDVDGVNVVYPYSAHDKITTLYHKRSSDGTWVDMGSTKVKDGDLLVYGKPTGFLVNEWMLIENVERIGADPSGRIQVGAVDTDIITALDVELYNIYKITSPIEVRDAAGIEMISNLPADGIINQGDYLICVDETAPNGVWKIFDNDYFEYHINVTAGATNESSKFPFIVHPAQVIKVYGAGNFGGQTGVVNYDEVNNDYIMYTGENQWKKYDTTLSISYTNRVESKLGDVIAITDGAGSFGSDTSKLDCPLYPPTTSMLFSKNDLLYYTGTHWIKVKPFNAYNNPLIPSTKDLINTAGFKSDFKIYQEEATKFQIFVLDLFDKQVIGRMNYFTGKLVLSLTVSKYKNDDAVAETVSITDIFKRDNYRNNARQMDVVKMLPAPVSFGYQGDFDTNFNQYVLADVKNTVII